MPLAYGVGLIGPSSHAWDGADARHGRGDETRPAHRRQPSISIFEMQDPGEPMRLDDDGLVMTSRTHAALSRKTLNLPALMRRNSCWRPRTGCS